MTKIMQSALSPLSLPMTHVLYIKLLVRTSHPQHTSGKKFLIKTFRMTTGDSKIPFLLLLSSSPFLRTSQRLSSFDLYVGETFSNQLQAVFTLAVGLIIGFTASWKISLVVIATFPINVCIWMKSCRFLKKKSFQSSEIFKFFPFLALIDFTILPLLWHRSRQVRCAWPSGQGSTSMKVMRNCLKKKRRNVRTTLSNHSIYSNMYFKLLTLSHTPHS